ncbi:MAG: DUF4149 domain-containing protein [Myxococcota bacterium]
MQILDALSDIMIASLFGGMVFLPSIVAPLVFKVLEPTDAGRFLRSLFPRYYAFVIATATAAALSTFAIQPWHAALLFGVAGSTWMVRQWLVPRINEWRDASLAGDSSATLKFDRGHRLSVWINMAQMLAVLGILIVR